ncbi:YfhO family protein [Virgibacillus litoralis]|uniref:Membrane protein YfhO n=1 Tax=Virgibacillus litoralis TaxID=578221 RepID=A0ABS4HJ46_9BACI|nr:YfhO family protein [Virgibacillus litoralis]MBP1950947.1 putative membrane protein YfhO [Virgibacillus litoralis]
MQKKRSLISLIICSLVVATLGHLFFITEWFQDRYMVGPNDGLQQMVTFKKLLYEQYTTGNFFYSYQFGLGGGTYSQLAFYFSTSFMFMLTTAFVYLLQSVQLIGPADTLFWANAAVFVSIGRLAIIITITSCVFRYMKCNWMPAFTGAAIYGLSAIYFRHVTYWEFFADAMLWVPLLVFAVEKIIREARGGWFIVAVAVTLFNNFYFAYVNLIFILIYIIFRWIIHLDENETHRLKQLKMYFISGTLGLGISAISFVPAVYGYLNNHRPPYSQHVPLFNWDNILFNSRFLIIPALFLILLFIFSLYKNRTFRLFAALSIIFILLHFTPLVASAFNGFSAPQYRWEYLLSFTIGGCVAFGLKFIAEISKRQLTMASTVVTIVYLFTVFLDKKISITSELSIAVLTMTAITILFLFLFIWRVNRVRFILLYTGLLILPIVFANVFQYGLSVPGKVDEVSKNHLQSEDYNGEEQRQVIQQIKDRDTDPFYRIDWKVGSFNNTPIVQNFNGMSVYGSILNKHLLYFYLYDLNIDMGRESVSRYATLGNRANLYSLLQGKYMVRERDNSSPIPYGFNKIIESENYIVFQNENILPFVRTAKLLFSEQEMKHTSVLAREHAMLEGAIVQDKNDTAIPKEINIIDTATLETVNASYNDNKVSVTDDKGGIDILVDEIHPETKDFYIHFHLENLAADQGFTLKVNDYKTTRKSNQSVYKTYDDNMTIRVAKADKVKIRLPKGDYILKDLALYQEDYSKLEQANRQATETEKVNWNDNRITITYNNQNNDNLMILPIPYEKGWEVKVNEEKQAVQKVNYAFVGLPIEKGINHIKLIYYPPYFRTTIVITLISLILSVVSWRRARGTGTLSR